MVCRYQAYPEYKDSGVEWLQDIPMDWEIKRTKAMFSLSKTQVGKKSGEYQLLSLTLKGVIPRDISDGGGKIPAEFDTYQVVHPRNLIFCLFDIDETPRTIGLSSYEGMITGAYNVYKSLEACIPEYAYYYFMHIDSFKGLRPFYTGLRKVVRGETFGNIKMPAPRLAEQEVIANFLDHETAKIDTLIEKQQQLIKLLKEKRQAVISHAVTKGLNPDAPMKDSGVEWLGEVPEHWKIGKCGFYLSLLSGFAFPSTGFTADERETKLLRGINVGVSRLKWDENVYWQRLKYDGLDLYEMQEGDLVLGMDRPLISEGIRIAKVEEKDLPCLLLQRVVKIKTGDLLNADYLLGLLSSDIFVAHFFPDTTGVSVPHISPEQIRNFVVPVPPLPEQNAIANFLKKETTKLDSLNEKAERVISLLQERRTALISAAVTGKIDVRNWQAPEQKQTNKECAA